jgi:hypothetical protein
MRRKGASLARARTLTVVGVLRASGRWRDAPDRIADVIGDQQRA